TGLASNFSQGVSLLRQFHQTGIGVNETVARTLSEISNAQQRSTQIYLSRQISPVLSVQTSYGLQSLTDRLNPSANGRSSTFSIQINAPFSFGSGVVNGRVDPHLPATITGRVIADTTSNPAFS